MRTLHSYKRLQLGFSELLLIIFSYIILLIFMALYNTNYIFSTFIALTVTYVIAYGLISQLSMSIGLDFRKLISIYSLSVSISIIVMYLGWYNMIGENYLSYGYGYDPQRYFFQAYELVKKGFNIAEVAEINYTGIIYFYGYVFLIFGHNPLIPLFINTILTLISSIFIIKIMNHIFIEKKGLVVLGSIMLIPEVLWYNGLTSREILSMSLITMCIYFLIKMLYIDTNFNKNSAIFFFIGFLFLALIRTTFIIPIIILLIFYVIASNYKKVNFRYIFIIIPMILVLVLLIPKLSALTGSYNFSFAKVINNISDTDGVESFNWSNNSIGRLLVADNIRELIIKLPARMIVYLIAPLPSINVSINGLLTGKYIYWQNLATVLSSIFYLISFKDIFAVFIGFKRLKNQEKLLMVFPFLILLMTVSLGTKIIHERYRIAIIPFLIAVIYIGRKTDRNTKLIGLLMLLILLVIASLIYIIIKL